MIEVVFILKLNNTNSTSIEGTLLTSKKPFIYCNFIRLKNKMECLSYYSEYLPYLIALALSLLGSLAVISIIAFYKLHFSYAFKILLFISINDLIRSIVGIIIILVQNIEILCITVALILDSLSLSNLIWSLCITYTIYQIVVSEEVNFTKHYRKWILLSYLLPIFLCSLPITTSSYGHGEGICELEKSLKGSIWRFSVFYFPIIIIISLILIMIIKVFKKIESINSDSMNELILERGFIYAFIIIIIEIPFFILRVIGLFVRDCSLQYAVMVMMSIFFLQGFANTLIFFYNKTVKQALTKREFSFAIQSFGNESLTISFSSVIN